jgi:hypothetical protein
VLVGGKTFHDREEVETIRAALAAIEWPDDELSVFATLRGALFAIGDEELLDWKRQYRAFHPFRVPGDVPPHLAADREALALLQQLHRRRNYVPVADTIQALLDATRAHVGLVLRRAASRRSPTCCTWPSSRAVRSVGRHLVPRLRGRAARRGRDGAGGRGADPRGGQRRRPPDDRAQGEGARVPRRDPGGPHVQAVARRGRTLDRSGTTTSAR